MSVFRWAVQYFGWDWEAVCHGSSRHTIEMNSLCMSSMAEKPPCVWALQVSPSQPCSAGTAVCQACLVRWTSGSCVGPG